MKANCWMGKKKVEVADVPDPKILNQRDAIVRITSTAICGSDLHLYNGFIPTMETGDILGHEFMGEVVEVGRGVKNLQGRRPGGRAVPDRVRQLRVPASARRYSLCENSNPNAWMAEKLWGHSPAGIFGYSHMLGGFAGGQAEYARVPFADVGPLKIPNGLTDEQVLFLSDIFPTGYMGAEMCDIKPGDVDRRLGLRARSGSSRSRARSCSAPSASSRSTASSTACEWRASSRGRRDDQLRRGRQRARHAQGDDRRPRARRTASTRWAWRRTRPALHVRVRPRQAGDDAGDRPADRAARGDHGVPQRRHGLGDRRLRRLHRQVPDGRRSMNRSLTIKTGQCHVQRYMRPLLERIQNGEIDPSFVITHRMPLEDAPQRLRHVPEQAGRLREGRAEGVGNGQNGDGGIRAERSMLRPFAIRDASLHDLPSRADTGVRWRAVSSPVVNRDRLLRRDDDFHECAVAADSAVLDFRVHRQLDHPHGFAVAQDRLSEAGE